MQELSVSRWARHRFLLMIGGSISIAIIFVVISTSMYYATGTAQLDLSRPDYKAVRSQVKPQDTNATGFSSDGSIDDKMFADFKKRYDQQAQDVQNGDSFNSAVLSDQALGLTSGTAADQTPPSVPTN